MKGRLSFQAEKIAGKTRLTEAYFSPPLSIADISEKGENLLHLMMRSSSPGILDGDDYQLDFNIHAEARVKVSSQSFQRLFDMKQGASQHTRIHVGESAALEYIALPCVPHKNSIFRSFTRIDMHQTAGLLFGEIFTCGRALNGESFNFSLYQSRLEIFMQGRLLVKENLRIAPHEFDVLGMGMLESHTHQAALTCVDEPDQLTSFEEFMEARILKAENITWGFSRPIKNVLVLRVLGYNAYKLYDILQDIAGLHRKSFPLLEC